MMNEFHIRGAKIRNALQPGDRLSRDTDMNTYMFTMPMEIGKITLLAKRPMCRF